MDPSLGMSPLDPRHAPLRELPESPAEFIEEAPGMYVVVDLDERARPDELDPTLALSRLDELEEELVFRDADGREVAPTAPQMIGLINDDSGDVQRVHLGLLARVEVPREWRVQVRETDGLEGSWRPVEELESEEIRGRLEEWSVHALEGLPALF